MSTAGTALFFLFSLSAVLSAIGTISMHSPIRAAMSLLAHIVSLSGLFLLLHAHVLAALQVLVYAGAVVVLFVFVIMMIGPAVPEPPVTRGMLVKTVSVSVMFIFSALLASLLMSYQPPQISLANCAPGEGAECDQFGGVLAFAMSLFGHSYVPFELISVLLTVAIIGAIAVARGRTPAEAKVLQQKRQERALSAPEPLAARERTVAAEVPAHGGH